MDAQSPPDSSHREAADDRRASQTCPYCGHTGTLAPLSADTIIDHNTFVSIRKCSNAACHGIVFYCQGRDGQVRMLPYHGISDGKGKTAHGVRNALEEATICHAQGCYIAAAVMIRRAVAELCDSVGIAAGDLPERLRELGTMIVMPSALLAGLHDLRMLGSAAAASEAAVYNAVTRKEVELGIACAKAMVKALDKSESLLRKLRALSTQAPA